MKKIIKNTAFILIGIILILAITIFAVNIINNFKSQRALKKVDSVMLDLKQKLESNSTGLDWKYEKYCENEMAGAWPTGNYICTNQLVTEEVVKNLDHADNLNRTVIDIVDITDGLASSRGKAAQTSTRIEKLYNIESLEGIASCIYSGKYKYDNNVGKLNLVFLCRTKSNIDTLSST